MKTIKQQFCLLLTLVILCISSSVYANFEDKYLLEKSMTEKAQHILDTMYGKHMFAVTTTVLLGNESWTVTYTEQAKIKTQEKQQKAGGTNYQILPGYSAIKNLSTDEKANWPYNATVTKVPSPVRKVIIDIVANKEISKKEARRAQKLLQNVLPLVESRGDIVNVDFQEYPIESSRAKSIENNFDIAREVSRPLQAINRLLLWGLIAVIGFIFLYVHWQRKILKKPAMAGGGGGAGGSVAKSDSAKDGGTTTIVSENPEDSMKRYFSFATSTNLSSLGSILKQEKLGAPHLGVVLSYLQPELAARLISMYPTEEQAKIIAAMADQKFVERELVEKLNDRIKSRLECLVGGNEKLLPVVTEISSGVKRKILQLLQEDKATYQKVRSSMLIFEDILYLSDEDVKKVIAEVNLDMLSVAMVPTNEKVRTKLEDNMSSSARAMIKQFMELKGKDLTEAEMDYAQSHIMEIVAKMDRDKKITLASNLPGVTSNNEPKKAPKKDSAKKQVDPKKADEKAADDKPPV